MTMATSLPLLLSLNQQSTKRWVPERDDDNSGNMGEREEEAEEEEEEGWVGERAEAQR